MILVNKGQEVNGYLASYKTTKSLTFADSTGTLNLFTVTGDVIVKILTVCTVNVVSAAAGNVNVGTAAAPTAILPATVASTLIAREIWHDASPDAEIEALSVISEYFITDGNDIVLVCSAQIDSGNLTFYCYFTPVSSDGWVVAA